MGNRKFIQFCSILITILVISSNISAKWYNYPRYISRYSINKSVGLPDFQKNKGPTRHDSSSSSLFQLSLLVRKYLSSPSCALLNAILASASVQRYSQSSTKLFENKSQYIQNITANGFSMIRRNVGLLYPTLNVFIPSSGTSSVYDINRTVNRTVWRSKLEVLKVLELFEVENNKNKSDGQQFFKPSTAAHNVQAKDYLGTCPVCTGKTVPPYVYQYRLSGSKYRQLLAGLALYNLKAISANQSMYKHHKHYIPQHDEICKFGVRYENGTNDEMAIDCRAITHFILTEQPLPHGDQAMKQPQTLKSAPEKLVVLQNSSSSADTSKYKNIVRDVHSKVIHNQIKPNTSGRDKARQNIGRHSDEVVLGNAIATDVMNATDPIFYGKPVNVTSKMECYVVGSARSLNMKKAVPCHVLEKYTVRSINSNSTIMIKSLIMVAFRFLFCYK